MKKIKIFATFYVKIKLPEASAKIAVPAPAKCCGSSSSISGSSTFCEIQTHNSNFCASYILLIA
jgi:hypothetical protein